MAKFGYTFGGGAPVMKRYKLNASTTTKGILMSAGLTTNTGLILSTTTAAPRTVGLTTDTGTYTSTQSTTMTEGLITVIVNPDAVYKFRMSGTTASGGALLTTTNSSASTAGTVVTITTGDAAPNSPTMLDGTMLCISGANALQANTPLAIGPVTVGSTLNAVDTGSRAITAVAATTATNTVPYPNTIAVGDVFLLVPFTTTPLGLALNGPILTTTLDEVRANAAKASQVGSAVQLREVELLWDSPAGTGSGSPVRLNSWVLYMSSEHVFNHNITAVATF